MSRFIGECKLCVSQVISYGVPGHQKPAVRSKEGLIGWTVFRIAERFTAGCIGMLPSAALGFHTSLNFQVIDIMWHQWYSSGSNATHLVLTWFVQLAVVCYPRCAAGFTSCCIHWDILDFSCQMKTMHHHHKSIISNSMPCHIAQLILDLVVH